MPTPIDITGQCFGRLTAIHPLGRRGSRFHWLCRCICGTEKAVSSNDLRRGKTLSCGCLRNERLWKHGGFGTQEYAAWMSMRSRVRSEHPKSRRYYKDKGIGIDPRWDDFTVFLADMGPCPPDRPSLNRKDNARDYSRGNCEWIAIRDQWKPGARRQTASVSPGPPARFPRRRR